MSSLITLIEIQFPVGVDFPPGFERALDGLVSMICDKYVIEHPGRTMWTAGFGAKPIWREPKEPLFDDSIYHIEVCEQEKTEPVSRYIDFTSQSAWIDDVNKMGYDLYVHSSGHGNYRDKMIAMDNNHRVGSWNTDRGRLLHKDPQ